MSCVRALRSHAAFLAVLTAATLARVYKLDAIPNPCADEGNWTWIPFDRLLGRPVQLPPDARFVPMTFGSMIETSFRYFGVNFASARAVCVVLLLVGIVLAYAILAAQGRRRAGLVVAIVLGLHPWAVWWSRTVSVPYAIALATGTVGPLGALAALEASTRARRFVGLIVAGQVLFFGFHFSPLAFVALAATGVWILVRRELRAHLRTPDPWIAFAAGLPHIVYVFRGVFAVAAAGATRPSHQFDRFGLRVVTFAHSVFGGLAGEATVRHFTALEYAWPVELALIVLVLALIAAAALVAYRTRARIDPLLGFSLLYLALATFLVPVLLAPARPWDLHSIDAERYLFAILAPFALLLGALAETDVPAFETAALAFALYGLVPTARIAHGLFLGGGQDHGIYVLHGGGGYRGWKTPRERIAVPWLIRSEVEREVGDAPATILVTDYAFHPIHFVNAFHGHPTVDVTKFPLPYHPHERFFFVLWSDGLFAPEFEPRWVLDATRSLRARMHDEFDEVRRVRTFVQPNGDPLFEIWTGVQRARAAVARTTQ